MANLSERDVFKRTIYAEARGESVTGQQAVAFVIKNRAQLNRPYWGGNSIKNVCLKDGQFECWNGKSDIQINEPQAYAEICRWADKVFDGDSQYKDPTGGADHYNNPDKEGYPPWTDNCTKKIKIGNHQFYKGP